MLRDISITEARDEITALPERLKNHAEALTVTRRGRPVLAIMPWEFYESIMETMEIMADKEMMTVFRQGVRELKQGKSIPWEKVKRKLDL